MSDLEETLLFQIKAAGIEAPVREHVFAKPRRFRFDFAWLAQMVACEVEGATWANGRHNRGAGFESDCVKYDIAAVMGWIVIRVTGKMIEDGRALDFTERALAHRVWCNDAAA